LVFSLEARAFQGTDDSCENNSSCALNIIVEARVLVLVLLECREWVLEILELNNNSIWVSNSLHKILDGSSPRPNLIQSGH
jgi:hypothetical protein